MGLNPSLILNYIQQVMSQEESMKRENIASGSGEDIEGPYETEDGDEVSSRRGQSSTTLSNHTTIKYSGNGGLYGESSVPSTLPAMPKLMGTTAHQYSEWKVKATGYFRTNGLFEVVTMKPSLSLKLASRIDGYSRPNHIIKSQWIRLNSKVYGAIRAAVEPVMGTSYFREIENDQ